MTEVRTLGGEPQGVALRFIGPVSPDSGLRALGRRCDMDLPQEAQSAVGGVALARPPEPGDAKAMEQ